MTCVIGEVPVGFLKSGGMNSSPAMHSRNGRAGRKCARAAEDQQSLAFGFDSLCGTLSWNIERTKASEDAKLTLKRVRDAAFKSRRRAMKSPMTCLQHIGEEQQLLQQLKALASRLRDAEAVANATAGRLLIDINDDYDTLRRAFVYAVGEEQVARFLPQSLV